MTLIFKTLITIAVICLFIAASAAVCQTYHFLAIRIPASPDGFSSACTNMLLLAIALKVCFKPS